MLTDHRLARRARDRLYEQVVLRDGHFVIAKVTVAVSTERPDAEAVGLVQQQRQRASRITAPQRFDGVQQRIPSEGGTEGF